MPRASKTGIRGLYRGSDGRWCIDLRWREPSTGQWRRYKERLPARLPAVAAKNRMREILGAALAGGWTPKRDVPRHLADALEEYLGWAEANRPRTARDRRSVARRVGARLGELRVDEINPFRVERYKRERLGDGVAPATVNREVAMLKHFLGLAAQWGWISSELARSIRAVRLLKEPPGRVRYLGDDEEARLLAALSPGVRPIVAAALLSGMRLGEVVALRREAVDLPQRMITLTVTKTNRVRRVPVNDALAAVLAEAMAASPGPHVFANRKGAAYTRSGVATLYRRAVARAGIEDLRFHDLRHDFATKVRRAGAGIDAIAELLGHASLAMARRYTHVGMDTLREAVSRLPALPSPVVPARSAARSEEGASPSRKSRPM